MAAAYPSGNPGNTFVPNFEASGKLVIGFSRNPKDFTVNRWTTLTPVKQSMGMYLRITPDNAARVLATQGQDLIWADGAYAPKGRWNTNSFEFEPFLTQRYAPSVTLGYKAVEQATWEIKAIHAAMLAQQAMTLRSMRAISVLETTGNYTNQGTFKSYVTSGGGSAVFAGSGTPTNPAVKYALAYAAQQIQQYTLGTAKPKDLVLVTQPVTASTVATGQEIHTYLKENPIALEVIKGKGDFNPNAQWFLPPTLYGFPLAIEDSVRVSTQKGETVAPAYVKSSNSWALISRPGSGLGVEGGRNWSFIEIFSYEEMTVWSKEDDENRLCELRVIDDYDVRSVSPVAGVLMTSLFS
jgi:hypothetical protein